MKDMFGREIRVGDTVTYANHKGSSTNVTIGQVLIVTEKNVRVKAVAGNDSRFICGDLKWNPQTTSYDRLPFDGYEASLTASGNVMISNGIDVATIRDIQDVKRNEYAAELIKARRG